MKIKSKIKRLFENIVDNNLRLSFAILVIVLVLVVSTWLIIGTPEGFGGNVLVEMVGMLFDAILLFFIFNWLQHIAEKRKNITRLLEELDDYRGWEEKEASYRVAGIVKRLKKEGVTNINFNHLHLGKVDKESTVDALKLSMAPASLEGANLQSVNLDGLFLKYLNLSNSNLSFMSFQNSKIIASDLSNTILHGVNFQDSEFYDCNFEESDFGGANFQNSRLIGVSCLNAGLGGANFQNSELSGDFTEAVLRETNLKNAILQSSIFDSVNLKNAVMEEADLSYASFNNADLKSAYLNGANLSNANFLNARLWGIELQNAKVESPDWLKKLRDSNVIGIEWLELNYVIDTEPTQGEYGSIFYLVKKYIKNTDV